MGWALGSVLVLIGAGIVMTIIPLVPR